MPTADPRPTKTVAKRHAHREQFSIKAVKRDVKNKQRDELRHTTKELWMASALVGLLVLNFCMFAWK